MTRIKRLSGFTLIELLVIIAVIVVLAGIVFGLAGTCSGCRGIKPVRSTGPSSYENQLRSASKIEIIERVISAGKHYDLYVNGRKVGEVTGKLVTTFGNVFTLTTADGKKLAYEEEVKRIFNWNRTARFFDGSGQVTGYIGEEKFKDFFSWGYIFHFYDPEKNEVGKSQKIGKHSWNYHHLYDFEGNKDYTVDKKFKLTSDKYFLYVNDPESRIPLEFAILLVCIEDIIADSN